jgi:hypothetical protein
MNSILVQVQEWPQCQARTEAGIAQDNCAIATKFWEGT